MFLVVDHACRHFAYKITYHKASVKAALLRENYILQHYSLLVMYKYEQYDTEKINVR